MRVRRGERGHHRRHEGCRARGRGPVEGEHDGPFRTNGAAKTDHEPPSRPGEVEDIAGRASLSNLANTLRGEKRDDVVVSVRADAHADRWRRLPLLGGPIRKWRLLVGREAPDAGRRERLVRGQRAAHVGENRPEIASVVTYRAPRGQLEIVDVLQASRMAGLAAKRTQNMCFLIIIYSNNHTNQTNS